MQSGCVRHTELPHTSRLFGDYVYHFSRVAHYYAHDPWGPGSFAEAAHEIVFPDDRRAALVDALREQNAGGSALDRLAQAGTVAVVTGQQVGLFSGPAYTIFKALTAVKLAASLSARGIPAVPVFWLATEDHDFAEVNHCWTFDASNHPVSLSVDGALGTQQPVGGIRLNEPPIRALKDSLADLPFSEPVAQMVEASYGDGRTMGSAFADLLRRILGGHELLYFDPMHPASRRLAAPLLRKAILSSADLKALVLDRNRELEAAGYHAQVHVEPETSFFFLLENGRRLTLRRHKQEYVSKERRFSVEELAEHAEHLSPNALLRPVVQDAMLPTVAYVGGPAELAYLAQAEVLYRELLGRMPVAVPRAAFTILDARAAKLMERYDLRIEHLFHGEEPLKERIAEKLIPPALSGRFREATEATARELDRVREELARFDATLVAALDKSRAKILYQLSKAERKTAREMLRRDQRAAADASYLSRLAYPNKHLQERFYSILPFLARHGLDLVDRLYQNVHLDCPDHLLYLA